MRNLHPLGPVVIIAVVAFSGSSRADDSELIYVTPRGTYRLQNLFRGNPAIMVSSNPPAQDEPLPDAELLDPAECLVTYGGSPDEKWIYRTENWRHRALRKCELYVHVKDAKFTPFKEKDWFASAAEAFAVESGGFKKSDFYEMRDGKLIENRFVAEYRGWSIDSSRLLLSVAGEGEPRDDTPARFYMYFNARKGCFELTPYLHALNQVRAHDPKESETPCAEPVDALPISRLVERDRRIREAFLSGWKKSRPPDEVKAMEAGLEIYLRFAPKRELELRRYQFIAAIVPMPRFGVKSP